jgi:hypothetical protein
MESYQPSNRFLILAAEVSTMICSHLFLQDKLCVGVVRVLVELSHVATPGQL